MPSASYQLFNTAGNVETRHFDAIVLAFWVYWMQNEVREWVRECQASNREPKLVLTFAKQSEEAADGVTFFY